MAPTTNIAGGRQSPAEMDAFVEEMLEQMVSRRDVLDTASLLRSSHSIVYCCAPYRLFGQKARFDDMGSSILGRMDEMGKRMEELESSIGDLMNQAGLETPAPTAASLAPPNAPVGSSGSIERKSISQRTATATATSVEV